MNIAAFAKELIREAGAFIRERMTEHYAIDSKMNPNDLVTDVDKEAERFIVSRILHAFPDHKIIGEEGTVDAVTSYDGVVWVIDPIDGTMNFVHQQENFAISIGIFIDKKPYAGYILDVMNDVLYHSVVGHGAYREETRLSRVSNTASNVSLLGVNPKWMLNDSIGAAFCAAVKKVRQTRNYGSAALEFAYTASGKLEGTLFWRLSPWDFAAGVILIEEVGGVITNLVGEPLTIEGKSSVIAANPQLHSEIVKIYSNDAAFVRAHHDTFN